MKLIENQKNTLRAKSLLKGYLLKINFQLTNAKWQIFMIKELFFTCDNVKNMPMFFMT